MTLFIISAVLGLLGFVCAAYVGKGKSLYRNQATILWFWVILLSPAIAYLYWEGGPPVVLAVFLLFCLAEILGLLFFCSRDKS